MGNTRKRAAAALLLVVAWPAWSSSIFNGAGAGVNGNAGASPVFSQTNSVTVTGTVAATTLLGTGTGSLTLPANFFAAAGGVLHVVWQGILNVNGSATNLQFALSLGGTTVGNTFLLTPGGVVGGNQACRLDTYITARTVGAAGTLIFSGFIECINGNTTNALIVGGSTNTATTTINTTVAELVDFKVTPGNNAQQITTTNFQLSGY